MELARQNPEFARFVQANKDKSVNQILQENGIDFSALQNVMSFFK